MIKTLYIRADGNTQIGLGHLVRCLALADMLKKKFNISFVCKSIPKTFVEELKKNQFKVKYITNEEDILFLVKQNDIVVIDHYKLGIDYHRLLKSKKVVVVCIDDIHDKEFEADLIINHAPGVKRSDYFTNSKTIFALGLDYVLLRKKFLNFAKTSTEKNYLTKGKIAICFGGSDFKNLTTQILKHVKEISYFKEIIVITGSAFIYEEELSLLNNQKIKWYKNITANEILEIFSSCEICVVPSSGILLEAIVSKCKIISGFYAENQKNLYKRFLELGCIFDANDFSKNNFLDACKKAILSTNEQKSFIDGKSNERIKKIFEQWN